jgi:hypothetical protein
MLLALLLLLFGVPFDMELYTKCASKWVDCAGKKEVQIVKMPITKQKNVCGECQVTGK